MLSRAESRELGLQANMESDVCCCVMCSGIRTSLMRWKDLGMGFLRGIVVVYLTPV